GVRADEAQRHLLADQVAAQASHRLALGVDDLAQLRQRRALARRCPRVGVTDVGEHRQLLAADDLLQQVAGRGIDHRASSLSWATGSLSVTPCGLARKRLTPWSLASAIGAHSTPSASVSAAISPAKVTARSGSFSGVGSVPSTSSMRCSRIITFITLT